MTSLSSIGTHLAQNTSSSNDRSIDAPTLSQRVHDFVMTHSLLWIGVGIVGAVVSCTVAFFIAEIALIGIIPSALLIILGSVNTSISSNPVEETEIPVLGIPNQQRDNSWASCLMQLILNSPRLEQAILEEPSLQIEEMQPFREFILAYKQALREGRRQFDGISTETIREACNQLVLGEFPQDNELGFDMYLALMHIMQRLPRSHPLFSVRPGLSERPGWEIIEDDAVWDEGVHYADIQRQGFAQAFERRIFDVGPLYASPPEELMIAVGRTCHLNNSFQFTDENIPVPERFNLSENLTNNREGASYECDTIIQTNSQHHFLCYLKKNGVWWFFDDANVARISGRQVQEALQRGIYFHYKKVD